MPDQPKRIIGRIDKVFQSRTGHNLQRPWGYLVTACWKRYQWHSNDQADAGNVELQHGDIVSFEPWDPTVADRPRQAKNVKLEKREPNPEVFGRLARFIREREEVA